MLCKTPLLTWLTPGAGAASLLLPVPGVNLFNVCSAVSYSPTLFRVQYHRRCGA